MPIMLSTEKGLLAEIIRIFNTHFSVIKYLNVRYIIATAE